MTSLLQILLIAHIIFGLLGVVGFYAVWMVLLKRNPTPKFLKLSSLWGLILLVLSWLTGGYYYATFYGASVKPIVKASAYPWAHNLFMEAKEHVFLFMPFLAAVLTLVIWLQHEKLNVEAGGLKKSLVSVAGITTIIGFIVTFAGIIISGAVR